MIGEAKTTKCDCPQDEIEQTQPGIFHIHIDALWMDKTLYDFAVNDLGFYDSDFNGHPEGFVHFEPQRHLTLKVDDKGRFEDSWGRIVDYTTTDNLKGYLEGEYIPIDNFIPYKEYKDIPVPFNIKRRRLKGTDREKFRQTEIHLTLEKDKSHPKLIQKLLESGLYGAFIPKDRGTFLVLTIQGFIKDIVPLIEVLEKFIRDSGGARLCTIKEERAIRHKLFDINSQDLPEIADTITYF